MLAAKPVISPTTPPPSVTWRRRSNARHARPRSSTTASTRCVWTSAATKRIESPREPAAGCPLATKTSGASCSSAAASTTRARPSNERIPPGGHRRHLAPGPADASVGRPHLLPTRRGICSPQTYPATAGGTKMKAANLAKNMKPPNNWAGDTYPPESPVIITPNT